MLPPMGVGGGAKIGVLLCKVGGPCIVPPIGVGGGAKIGVLLWTVGGPCMEPPMGTGGGAKIAVGTDEVDAEGGPKPGADPMLYGAD